MLGSAEAVAETFLQGELELCLASLPVIFFFEEKTFVTLSDELPPPENLTILCGSPLG